MTALETPYVAGGSVRSHLDRSHLAALIGAGAGAAVGFAGQRGWPGLAALALLFGLLAAVSVVDLRERRIPNRWTYPGLVALLALAALAGPSSALAALLGALLAGGYLAVWSALGRGALGVGDVKLGAVCGAALGLSGALPFLLVGTGLGALTALALLALGRTRDATFPYGPSLALGAALVAMYSGPVAG